MSVDLEPLEASETSLELQYRSLSSSAVASLVIGLLSCLAILAWSMVMIPIVGVMLGVYACTTIRRRSDELAGMPLARLGLGLSLTFLAMGPSWLIYERMVEVPEGYERISYDDLQPDPDRPSQVIPPSALALHEKQVFIKGYVYPGRDLEGIKQFLLVRDQGDCCFGGNPKLTDRIQVTLADPERLTFHPRLHKVAGVFRVVHLNRAVTGPGGVYYELDEAHLR